LRDNGLYVCRIMKFDAGLGWELWFGNDGDSKPVGLLQFLRHWGVAALRLEEAYVNTLDPQVMA